MLRTAFRTSFRRALHSSAAQSRPVTSAGRVAFVLGATAATVGVLTWKSRGIALDAVETRMFSFCTLLGPLKFNYSIVAAKKPLKAKATISPQTLSPSEPEVVHHEPPVKQQDDTPASPSSSSDSPSPEASAESPAPEGGESSGASGGAFNPETGEINWDCPCLGGMAHGPCGMQFRDAFSCFVYSEDEPKGINCVEKFKAMQDCFREHPDVYGEGTLPLLRSSIVSW